MFWYLDKTMANLTLRGVPDDIHADLKNAARSAGKSLNAYIISLLELSTEERWRHRMMREHREPFRKFVESLPEMTDSTSILRADRERGH